MSTPSLIKFLTKFKSPLILQQESQVESEKSFKSKYMSIKKDLHKSGWLCYTSDMNHYREGGREGGEEMIYCITKTKNW